MVNQEKYELRVLQKWIIFIQFVNNLCNIWSINGCCGRCSFTCNLMHAFSQDGKGRRKLLEIQEKFQFYQLRHLGKGKGTKNHTKTCMRIV